MSLIARYDRIESHTMWIAARFRVATLAISFVLATSACGPAATVTPVPSAALAPPAAATAGSIEPVPSGAEPRAADWARIGEAFNLLGVKASAVWAGWGEATPPILLESDTDDYLVGHPAPPAGFEPAPGLELIGRPVLQRAGHLVPGIGVQEIDHVASVVAPTRERLQALVDQALGPGAVNLDDVQYVRWITHEAFHAFELTTLSDELPRFGFDGSESDIVRALSATPGFEDALAREGSLLLDALEAQDDAATLATGRQFLDARAARRATVDAHAVAFERAVEWAEGLARYADIRLLQAAGDAYEQSPAFTGLPASYPRPMETWATAIRWLSDLSSVPGTLRDRYYELGAGEAYVLDRLMPDWHRRALPGGESLEALVAAAITAGDAGIPRALRVLATREVRLGDLNLRVAIADVPEAWARGLEGVRSLGPLGGLLFAFPTSVDAKFHMQGAVVPLDIAFIDEAGRLIALTTMSTCEDTPCPAYGSTAPYRWALEAPAGTLSRLQPGDQLELEIPPSG